LGINFHQLEVNKSKYSYNPTKRDGIGYVNNLNPKIQPNYIANDGAKTFPSASADSWTGKVQLFESQATKSDYNQPRELWNEFKKNSPMDKNFVSNVAMNLSRASKDVRDKTYRK
jgi:catalase